MLDKLNDLCLLVADPLLNWMLYLPRDLALIIVAVCTALILTVVRRFTTRQDLLKRRDLDKKRLKQLIREAKGEKDKQAVRRCRTTLQQINMRNLSAEILPLLASLIPIALLAVWAFARLAYLPPQAGKPIKVMLYTPVSCVGDYVHIVPQEGIRAEDGWLRRVKESPKEKKGPVNGIAEWTFVCEQRETPYVLKFRRRGRTCEKELIVDGLRYAAQQVPYGDHPHEQIALDLAEYRPLGILPGWKKIGLQPWLLGYLIVVLPLAFVLRPLLRTY